MRAGILMYQSSRALAFLVLLLPALAETPSKTEPSGAPVARVGSTAFIQLRAESFNGLDARQKELAYWLTQASIAIDPIIYDQLSAFGIREKRLLEEIEAHPAGIDAATRKKITDFAELFWANRGNHNETTAQKFLPDFTYDDLQKAARRAFDNGAFRSAYADLPPLPTADAVSTEILNLKQALFDPDFEPMITAKSPRAGQDIIQASSNTFYGPGVTLADLKNFTEKYPLNSSVVKGTDGRLTEEVWRAGTPDGAVPPGKYAIYLKKANEYFARAQALADPKQAAAIGDLIRYYQTGNPADWLAFGAKWVGDNPAVDFDNGFIEV